LSSARASAILLAACGFSAMSKVYAIELKIAILFKKIVENICYSGIFGKNSYIKQFSLELWDYLIISLL